MLPKCDLPSDSPLSLLKFYKSWCPHSKALAPVFEEVSTRLERNNAPIVIKEIDCDTCDCKSEGVDVVPTVMITKQGVEKARVVGYKDFDQLVDLITKNTEILRRLFRSRIKNIPGKVVTLREPDFYSGFDGPWLVLFYWNSNDPLRARMAEMATIYKGTMHFGEISSSDAQNILHRYNIETFPTVVGIFNGINAGYYGDNSLESLRSFADRLIAPSFDELDLDGFNALTKKIKKGEPIFIVFYSNLSLANSYFRQVAHEYKFKATIYKSSDPALFEKASIFPQDPEKGKHIRDEDMVVLSVYRNGQFHQSEAKMNSRVEIAEWIFRSHFPYLSKIDDQNFFGVFHGLKPVVLLLDHGEEHASTLEKVSEAKHLGQPFSEQVFALLNVDEYPMFIPSLLPNIPVPSVVIFDPRRQLFFYRKFEIRNDTLFEETMKLIRDYEAGKLRYYPYKSHWLRNALIMALGVILVAGILKAKSRKTA
ncbi:Thioredoxin domain-containing protein 5 like protein [Astathelohania contejeani]|uniref:Thioredoxin domain-containing protein 5 like protein n=1 Tax=Astathelohania contejeani TaxID=164912 RepID=A0ABQ7HX95_9MICR|nr:Thioredoxin domain-containing protein 5 like protein [Thelohania contejeani]